MQVKEGIIVGVKSSNGREEIEYSIKMERITLGRNRNILSIITGKATRYN